MAQYSDNHILKSKMFARVLALFALFLFVAADNQFICEDPPQPPSEKDKTLVQLNSTTGGPYTYSQSGHHFYGVAFDGSYIDVMYIFYN